jgi:hypothetical protein
MRGKKTQLWEGGHRVPCFIRWPSGDIGPPRGLQELCQVQDLLPTLADLAGIAEIPTPLDGDSLGPIFRGRRDTLGDRLLVINYSRMPTFQVTYTRGNPAIPRRDGAAVLWKDWRLLENRRLYDVKSDPHQDRDVAPEYPEVVATMQNHLQTWWDTVKDDVMHPQRVVIGNDAENPMLLTACEWLDVFVDQQRQIRRGDRKNGVWHLIVDRSGTYQFDLRRYPRESGLPLQAALPETEVTDGTFVASESLPIAAARLRIGDHEETRRAEAGGESIRFQVDLEAGPIEMQTWMLDRSGNEICGAYYVYVTRL